VINNNVVRALRSLYLIKFDREVTETPLGRYKGGRITLKYIL
jgi:hypothetical protein